MSNSLEQEIGALVVAAVRKALDSAGSGSAQRALELGPGEPRQQSAEAAAAVDDGCGHYFLDEACDSAIFGKHRRIIVGREGCSNFMILGLLAVADPDLLDRDLTTLRAELTADPYFAGVPSLDPSSGKTAAAFHAKDDLPEVRREVFKVLLRHELSFSAVVSHKLTVLSDFILPKQDEDPAYRFNPNDQYDYQVRCLFKGRLHKKPAYNIHFAHRGKSDRTEALKLALMAAQASMNSTRGGGAASVLNVSVHRPADLAGLQAADYFLWALQRLYERREVRFFDLIRSKVSLVNDRGVKRAGHHGGIHFTRKKPLTREALDEFYDTL